jgi:hypothetical protein
MGMAFFINLVGKAYLKKRQKNVNSIKVKLEKTIKMASIDLRWLKNIRRTSFNTQ